MFRTGALISCEIDGKEEISFVAPGINKNLDVYSILFLGEWPRDELFSYAVFAYVDLKSCWNEA